jgi:hypothetical protein
MSCSLNSFWVPTPGSAPTCWCLGGEGICVASPVLCLRPLDAWSFGRKLGLVLAGQTMVTPWAPYLLGGVVGELHARRWWRRILSVSPALQAVGPATMASTVVPLGVMSFVKVSLKNLDALCGHLHLSPLPPSAFGGVPRCAYICLRSTHNGCPAALDLAIVAWLS